MGLVTEQHLIDLFSSIESSVESHFSLLIDLKKAALMTKQPLYFT